MITGLPPSAIGLPRHMPLLWNRVQGHCCGPAKPEGGRMETSIMENGNGLIITMNIAVEEGNYLLC